MKYSIIILLGLFSFFVLNSCKDAYDFSTDNLSTRIEQKTDIAVPLINASITMEEILPDKEEINRGLIVDPDGFLRLVFEYNFDPISTSEFFNGSFSSPPPLPYLEHTADPETVELGLDEFLGSEGELYFADPKMKMTIKNYWDVPVRIRFNNCNYYEGEGEAAKPFTGDAFDNWISINRPEGADFDTTVIEFTKDNSNVPEVISSQPHSLSFGAVIETIPGGDFSVDQNTQDSLSMNIEIPLDLRISNLSMQDTLDFSLGEDGDTSAIESVELNIIVDNGFPIAIDAELLMADENYNILGLVTTDKIEIAAGQVTDGEVTASTESIIKVVVDDESLQNMGKASYLIPIITFNTANAASGETVKLYSQYNVGLKMSARIKLKLKT